MKTCRGLSVSSLNQSGAVEIGANPFRRHFRKGRRSPFGALRTVGIIAITVVLVYFNGFPEAEAASVCEATIASYLANPQQCETDVQGTVEEVTRSYQNRGYVRFQDTELWRNTVLPEYGDLLAGIPCEFLVDHDLDDDTDYSDVTFAIVCPSVTEDFAGVMISRTELRIVEGESASYAVSLGSEPEGTVTVSIGVIPPVLLAVFPSPPTFDVTVSTTSLSFSSSNWSVPQTVTVRVAEDDHVSGDLEYTIAHRVGGYGNVTTADDVVVLAVDNDSPSVTVTPTALTVDEGSTGSYTVVLTSNPDRGRDGLTVTVTPKPDPDNADVTFTPTSLSFTADNWSTEQRVTVSAADDPDALDESATITHEVSGYGNVTSADAVTVTVRDDDSDGVTVTPTALTVDEGETGTYTVVLTSNPDPGGRDGLTVTVTPKPDPDNADVTFTPASLRFTADNWSTEQRVTVSAAQDDAAADESATLTHAVSGYGEVTAADVTVTVRDDDSVGVTVTPTTVAVDEGSTGSYTVVLTSNPDPGRDGLTVTVTPSPDPDNADVTFTPASLRFTADNWSTEQRVTVSAAQDDDAADESATLTHAVSGYGEVTAADVTVTVRDDDSVGVTVTPTTVAVDEGSTGSYTVVLTSNPDPGRDGLTVTVTPSPDPDNADVTFTPASLRFTADNWSTEQRVTVSAAQDDDAADESATLTHAVSGYGEVTAADVTVRVTDTTIAATAPDPPRDLKAIPGDRQVMLQWRAPESDGDSPIIRYDYQVDTGQWISTGGTDTSHVVRNLDNGTTYMFRVRVVNAANEQSPSSDSESALVSATPMILTPPILTEEEREAVADTVQAVTAATAANITANIGTRFSATRSGGNMVVVGGRTLNLGSAPTPSSLPVTIGRDWDLFAESGHDDDGWGLGLDDLLRSSAFELSLSAAEDGVQNGGVSPQWTVWGRGDLQFFESQPERGATYDGDLKAGYLGIDARLGDRWLAGLATSLTRAEADYDTGDDSSGGDGVLGIRMTGVHPYLRYAPDAKSEFWTILGAGRGEIENERAADVTRETSDITMWMGAAGARRSLVSVEALDLALLGDVGFARVETEDGLQAIHGLTVDSWRARLGVEGSHTASLASGATLTSFVEVAGRYDGGDGDDEVGLEVSPGLYISDPNTGLGVEVRGRVLALHSAESYKEHGVSMTASLSPGSNGLGLSLSLSPRWGANTEGADTSWRDDTFERLEFGAAQHDAMSFDARVGYGVRAMSGLLTPFGEFSLRDQDSRQMRIGARFNRQHSSLGALSLELSGERRESPVDDPEHRVGVIGRLRF